jgi:hypothetical protein
MAERLEGQIDIKTTKTQKELDKMLKKLQNIENKIDDVSRSELDPRVRERRITSLNKQLKITEASVRRLKGQKIDIQIDKEGRLDKFKRNIRGVGNVITAFWAGAVVQSLAAVGQGLLNLSQSATEMKKLTVGMDSAVEAAGVMNRGVNASVDGIIEGLNRVSKGMIKPLEAQEFFNLSLQLGLVQTQEQFEQLTQNALILGQKTGLSVKESLGFITEGVAKGSPEILNNAGIVFTAAEAYEILAKKIGKSVSSLTESERQTARQQLAIQRLNEAVAEYGGEAALVVDGNEKLAASWERAKIAFGNLIALPANDFLTGLAERLEVVAGLTDVWGDNLERLPDVITAVAGTDLGMEGTSEGVTRRVLEMDLTSLDQAIEKEREFLAVAEKMGATQVSIQDATARIANLESERLAIAEKLATVTPSQEISPNVNAGIAQALELQQQQQAAQQAQNRETGERIALLKTLQALQKQGFLSTESYSEQLLNKEQSLGDLRLFTEQAVQSAQVQTHASKLNQLNEVAAKTQEVAQLEATIEAKKADALASFEKRRNQFYANEAKRVAEAREQGLESRAAALVGRVGGELSQLFGIDDQQEVDSRDVAENARRLAAVAAGDINGEAARLLKEGGFWGAIFGAETDPAIIQKKAQEIGGNFQSMIDFGLIDVETAADKIVDSLTGGSDEQAFQDAVMAELQTRGLSPELLDKAFNITRQEFGEQLDISLVGEDERQRIEDLNAEIEKLGDQVSMAIADLTGATKDLEKQSEVWDKSLDDKIAKYREMAMLMGIITGMDPGVFGGGGDGVASPEAGGAPPSPNTSFTTPAAPLPTADFTAPRMTTARAVPQGQPQAQQAGGQMQGVINATFVMPDGEMMAQQTIPYIARAMK